jgi:trk system potassium uptake protein TrkH
MKLINPLLILRILSTILFIETISFLLCIPVALIYSESLLPFYLSAAVTGFLSVSFYPLSRNANYNKFSSRDGYLVVTLSWLLFLSLGALPYIFSGTIPSVVDAFFESSSGFTTTGSTIIEDVESLPYSILFWRSLTHWMGGLGIIVLVIVILPSLRITGYQLFSLESSMKDKIHPKTKAIGFRIMFIYLGLTLAQLVLLWLGDMNLFDSICHTFGTIATGGFSTKNDSLISYSPYSQYIVMIFMFFAGTSQVVYYYLFKLNFKKIRQNEELWFYLATVIFVGVIISSVLLLENNKNLESALREGFFNVISILTTTGFSSADYLLWPVPAIIIIFLLLFAGASTGSTTGSIKMARHLIAIKNIRSVFIKLSHPNALTNIRFNGKLISEKTNISIVSFIVLYLFIFLIGTVLIVITGTDVITAASSVAASLGNVGPALGTLGPMSNYAHLPGASKLILSILMIIGRVEIITVFVLFTRSFWKL